MLIVISESRKPRRKSARHPGNAGYRLRQKVEKDAASPAILVTEAGGYKLVP